MNITKTLPTLGIVAMSLVGTTAFADAIPYPTPGIINPITYTFTASSSGNITAYFAGSTASYVNELTMRVNGVATGIVGLNNHTSFLGQSLVLGAVNAGDTLVFELINHTLGLNAYSDPSLNGTYDGGVGLNHVYSTAYTQTPPIDSIPVGTYVAFEDLRGNNSGNDWNYHDETFVFQNVSVSNSVPDGASSLLLLGLGLTTIVGLRRRFAAAA